MASTPKAITKWHKACVKCGISIVRCWHIDANPPITPKEHLRLECVTCEYVWIEATKDDKSGLTVVEFKR